MPRLSKGQSVFVFVEELYTEKNSYNFMIGADGTVFEGRGWDSASGENGDFIFSEYGKMLDNDYDITLQYSPVVHHE